MNAFPRISIVTPSFNDSRYLERAIRSLLDQGYPNLEYVIVDGGSTDGTVEIISRYADQLAAWMSEPDEGMYHALSKGFALTTGEIMGWLNADDRHFTGSLFTLAKVFSDCQDVNWIQGVPAVIDANDRVLYARQRADVNRFYFYRQLHIRNRGYIQQESTFWRRRLWEKAGSFISTDFQLAGDFDLWLRFFKQDRLFNVPALIGAFRMSGPDQLSIGRYPDYLEETIKALEANKLTPKEEREMRRYFRNNALRRRLLSWIDRFLPVSADCAIDTLKYDLTHNVYRTA